MTRLKSIFRFLFRRQKVEHELDAELQYHVDRQTELNISRGMTSGEARRQAVLSVGGIEPLKDECREARTGRLIETFLQDARYGLRVLRKNPGYTFAAVVTLALGIGANTAMFSLVYGVFLRPLPYRDGGQLVVLHQQNTLGRVSEIGFSPQEISDYCDRNHTLDAVVEHHSMTFLLLAKDTAERVSTSVVSVNFFDVLGVRPLLGRTFVPADGNPSSGAVLVLSYKYWQGYLRGDPSIVGKVFQMNNLAHTVIGVLPPIPQYPVESDVYMPTWQCPFRSNPRNIANRRFRLISAVFGRLKSGTRLERAQADLSVVAHQFETEHPDVYPARSGFALATDALQYDLTHTAQTTFLVLLGVSAFVLLIACANVANMMLARLLKLERELAVRSALGAGRMRLMRQWLTESLLLSAAGGAVGLAIAPLTLGMLIKFGERFTTRAAEVRIDGPVLLFTLLVSLATGLLFGLAPAFSPWQRVGDALRQGGRSTSDRGRRTLRGALVVTQVAVSLVLLIGAGLMMRSFLKLQRENPGFDPNRLLSMRVSAGLSRFRTDRHGLMDNISRQVQSIGGVVSTGWASNVPFSPDGIVSGPGNVEFQIEGRPSSKGTVAPTVDITDVDAGYFQTVRQPLLKGRYLSERDDQKAIQVAVINETMARHRWPGEDPIGKRVSFDNGDTWITIVGVAGDTREYGLEHPTLDEIYLPVDQGRNRFVSSLLVRTAIDPTRLLPLVRSAIRGIDPLIALDQVSTMESFMHDSLAPPRLMTILLGLFAGLALLSSASGIAAVMALSVSQRTHELGVRMALGARQGAIIGMVVRQGLLLAAAGTVAGVTGAVLLSRVISTLLYATSPTDVLTFIAVSLLFLAVAAVACFIPARQVTTIDPLNALRQE